MDSRNQQRICGGFLITPLLVPVDRRYLVVCAFVMFAQALVGLLGFGFHMATNMKGPSADMLLNLIHGAPPFAPLLFPNLMVLAFIGLETLTTLPCKVLRTPV